MPHPGSAIGNYMHRLYIPYPGLETGGIPVQSIAEFLKSMPYRECFRKAHLSYPESLEVLEL